MIGDTAETIDLAREPDFPLGEMTVSPSTGRVLAADREQRIQPRVMEVLVLLSRRAGTTVSRDDLIDACWSGRIVSENAVNRVLAQVRALARMTDPPAFVLDTVPKVGVRLVPAEALGAAGSDLPAPTRGSNRLLVLAGFGALAFAFGILALLLHGRAGPSEGWQNGRVEVLAFTATGDDPVAQRAAAATSQDVIRLLSRGGVSAAPSPSRDAAAADAELQLAGTIGRQGDDYVIDARIVDRRSGLVLWTDRILRSRRGIIHAPGETAAPIAAVLNCALVDRNAANAAVTTEAFGLYLNACAGVFLADDNGQRMLTVSRRLVKAAPRYAGAHAMHAIAAARVAVSTELQDEAAALHAEAKAAAMKALALDPRTAKAYSGLALNEGVLTGRMRQDWAAEARYLRAALAIDPDLAPARNEYAAFLRATGRLRDAIQFTRASSANEDPRYGGDPRTAIMLAAQGDLAAAEAELKRREARDGVSMAQVRATIAFWWQEPHVALQNVDALVEDRGPQRLRCLTTYLAGLQSRRAAGVRGLPPDCASMDLAWRARMLARQGDVDGAFASIRDVMPGGPILLYYPEMASVRADPRFWRLAKRWGLLDYWRSSGRWPDFCAAPGQDCRGVSAAATSANVPSAGENPSLRQR
jgi:DNA-binding winged helix-turn-helix (wHTH) protein/TolB-like protein